MTATPGPARQVVGIDLLRFVAAAMVLLFHLGYCAWAIPASEQYWRTHTRYGDYAYPAIAPLAWYGWIGVEIFFVISGFVIVYSASGSAWSFARSRFLRLVPGAWICAAISALVFCATKEITAAKALDLFGRAAFFAPDGPWIDSAYWTLDVEVAFYALIAVLLATGQRTRLGPALAALGGVSTIFWIARFTGTIAPGWPIGGRIEQLLLLRHGAFFAVGGLMYLVHARPAHKLYTVAIAIGLIGCLIEIVAQSASYRPIALSNHLHQAAFAPVAAWLVTVAFMGFAVRCNEWLSGVIPPPLARQIGLATYPLYLLHGAIGSVTMRIASKAGANATVALIGAFAASVATAVFVAQVAEPGLRRVVAHGIDPVAAAIGARRALKPAA